ncbi:MAG: hypothetical protein Q8O83_00335 [bacterium]|nr:hypothetical protein [bacterium]
MRRVIIESPFKGDEKRSEEQNVQYARACAHDCISRGEAPFASHLFYTQEGILNDLIPEERMMGIHAGQAWGVCADLIVVYIDHGISKGMQYSIEHYGKIGIPIEERTLYKK